MNIKIGDLGRAQREEMYNLHAMYVDPDATESSFFQKWVPVKLIDLTVIDRKLLYPMSQEDADQFYALAGDVSTKYPVITQGKLIDGLHRITADIMHGETEMEALDFGSLINPELSGFQFDISVISPKPQSGTSKKLTR